MPRLLCYESVLFETYPCKGTKIMVFTNTEDWIFVGVIASVTESYG